jgi:hypothetical protein
MGIFTSGEMVSVGNAGMFYKRDPKTSNIVYILNKDLASVMSAPKFGVFTASGSPFNASWVSIGAKDVGFELGVKPQPKAFFFVLVPVNPKNLKEGFSTKLWEASKTEYETISTQVNEFGHPLQGMMVVMTKPANRWTIAAQTPPANRAVEKSVIEEAWSELVAKSLAFDTPPTEADEKAGKMNAFYELVGVRGSVDLERKFLVERSQGKAADWNGVRKLFGLGPVADGGTVENDVEDYE